MRRRFELIMYMVIIAIMIIRYAGTDLDKPRRGGSVINPSAPLPVPGRDIHVRILEKRGGAIGTAFAVDDSKTYITARHVVEGCRELYFMDGNRLSQKITKVQSARHRDFAVLETRNLNGLHLKLVTRPPRRGDDGFMMGYPQGRPADVRATMLGITRMKSSGRYSMMEPVIAWVERGRAPIFDGALGGISGGPVLDRDGNVIGTVVAGTTTRGRQYTTHPAVFDTGSLVKYSEMGRVFRPRSSINTGSFHDIGKSLRSINVIRKLYCKAR